MDKSQGWNYKRFANTDTINKKKWETMGEKFEAHIRERKLVFSKFLPIKKKAD